MHSGETIKLLRTLKGFSQKGLAKKLGISQPAYCKLEKRTKVNASQLQKILEIINCSKEDLEAIQKFTPPRKDWYDESWQCTVLSWQIKS